MAERDGAWVADATIAGGVDPNKDTHPLNCDTTGTLEVVGIVTTIPGAVTPVSQSGIWNIGVNNFPPFLFNSDGSLRIQFASSSRLLWDTDVDWNKGTKTYVETSGTGPSAVIRPASNTGAGDITYNTASDYTLSSGTDLEIADGTAHLKPSSTTSDWPFTTPSDYTYDSDIIVSGGNAALTPTSVVPYAWYHLNAASGTVVTDSSGNGRNGTTVNMEDGDWQVGKLNNCLNFNEGTTNEYVDCGNIASFERTDAFSIEVWVKSSVASKVIIARHNATTGWFMYIDSDGKLMCYLSNNYGGSNNIARKSADVVTTDTWHHVVLTYNGSSTVAGLHIYLDGALNDGSILQDSLTGSIVVGTNTRIGNWGGSALCWKGKIDEVVIYNIVLDPSAITFRYNSGIGTETILSSYVTSTPTIYPNTGIVSGLPVTSFIEASTKPAGTEIKYQISSDDGVTWKYWTGSVWAVSDLTYSQASLASAINTNIATLATAGTYRFRALLSSTGFATPLLDQVTITSSVYPTIDNLYVDTKNVSQIVATSLVAWTLSTFTDTLPAGVDARVLFSIDGRSTWLTWNGSSWVIPVDATLRSTATTLPNVTIGFSQLPIGSGTLDVRLFLYSSDVRYSPTVDNIHADYSKGFYTLASYETNVFDSHVVSQPWGIYDVSEIIPVGTTVVIKCRVSNSLSSMGSYGSPLVIGNSIGLNGEFIQFSVDFTGTLVARALVDYIAVRYMSPPVQDVNP